MAQRFFGIFIMHRWRLFALFAAGETILKSGYMRSGPRCCLVRTNETLYLGWEDLIHWKWVRQDGKPLLRKQRHRQYSKRNIEDSQNFVVNKESSLWLVNCSSENESRRWRGLYSCRYRSVVNIRGFGDTFKTPSRTATGVQWPKVNRLLVYLLIVINDLGNFIFGRWSI